MQWKSRTTWGQVQRNIYFATSGPIAKQLSKHDLAVTFKNEVWTENGSTVVGELMFAFVNLCSQRNNCNMSDIQLKYSDYGDYYV